MKSASPTLVSSSSARLAKRLALHVAAKLGTEHDILVCCLPGDQRGLLEHHHTVPGGAGDPPSVEQNLSAIRPLEARDQIDERRLAASRRADDDRELAGRDIEAEVLDDLLPLPFLAVGLADAPDLDAGLRLGAAGKAGSGVGRIDPMWPALCIEGACRADQNKLPPGHDAIADPADDAARQVSGNADRDHADDDLRHGSAHVRIPDEKAEAAASLRAATRRSSLRPPRPPR